MEMLINIWIKTRVLCQRSNQIEIMKTYGHVIFQKKVQFFTWDISMKLFLYIIWFYKLHYLQARAPVPYDVTHHMIWHYLKYLSLYFHNFPLQSVQCFHFPLFQISYFLWIARMRKSTFFCLELFFRTKESSFSS